MQSNSILGTKYDRSRFTLANPAPWRTLERIKGQRFLDYRALLARAETGEVLTDFPVEVLLKTTLNCNHDCPKCLHGMGVFPAGVKFNMKLETVQKVLDEGSKKGLQSVVFTGGEPTIHPRIREFIRYAGALMFPDISMVTNGSRLNEGLCRILVESGVTRINVSLDAATRETYFKVHGVDEFDKVVANIETLLRVRAEMGSELPLLSLSFVLYKECEHELDAFLERWAGRADGGVKIYPYKNIFSVVDERFSETYGPGRKLLAQLPQESLPVKLGAEVPFVTGYSVECMSPWYRCHVGINGELQGCTTQGFCDHPDMVMGNIHNAPFETAWKSDAWNTLRDIVIKKEFDRHPVCRTCQRCV